MYWLRAESVFSIIPWFITALLWSAGGWLLVSALFNNTPRERVLLGVGVGLTFYLWLVNIFARFLLPDLAFFLPGLMVLIMGITASVFVKPRCSSFNDFRIWPELGGLVVLCVFFTLTGRGLGIFDEPKNLSLISLMARGEIPPKYYLDGQLEHAYHYGSQLLGASLMRLGGLFPWSAFDISKALYWAYLILLVYVFLKRRLISTWKAVAGTAIFPFLSGTRFLLSLLPAQVLQNINPLIEFEGVSTDLNATLSQSLNMTWSIAGGPSGGYPFAFLNSFHQPFIMAHAGTWTYAFVLVFLIWLLAEKLKHPLGVGILTILMSMLALTWESTYALLAASIGLVVLSVLIRKKNPFKTEQRWLLYSLLLSAPVVLIQGGVLSQFSNIFINIFHKETIFIPGSQETGLFSLNPALLYYSTHFGPLYLNNLWTVFIILIEFGPVIFLAPIIFRKIRSKNDDLRQTNQVIGMSAILGLIIPLIFYFDPAPRDISRFTQYGTALLNLGFILLIFDGSWLEKSWGSAIKFFLTAMCMISGLVLAASQISAISSPILAEGIDGFDARVMQETWDKLENDAFVFDPGSRSWRATMLTGRYTRASIFHDPLPEWEEMRAAPNIDRLLELGYRYIYIDELWWRFLEEKYKPQFKQACVREIAFVEETSEDKSRRLLDLTGCAKIQ